MNESLSPARTISSTEELLAYSLAMETEAVERFNGLAEQMEMHHNYEVAELFHKLAKIEGLHIDNVKRPRQVRSCRTCLRGNMSGRMVNRLRVAQWRKRIT